MAYTVSTIAAFAGVGVDQSSVEDVRQADRADFKQIARSRARAQTLEEALRDEVRKGSGS